MITYRTGNELDLEAVIELYRASTLGERRPVDDKERMSRMLPLGPDDVASIGMALRAEEKLN